MRLEAVIPARDDWAEQYPTFHVSPGIRAGDHLYCCAVTGWDPQAGMVAGDPEAQFDQAFRNVAEILEAGGASWANVVRATSYHVGALHELIPVFVAVRDRYIVEPYPVWTAAVVSQLPDPDALVQLEVTAVIPTPPGAGPPPARA